VARGGEKHRHNSPLASGKGSIYEGGIRVPMLAYWPGTTAAGTTATHPVIIEDFFTSILEMAQIARPQHVQTVDGQSFVPVLKGLTPPTRPLFWHYPNEWGPEGPGIGSFSAIRLEDWKLIYFHSKQQFELYNLSQDISEQNNLFFEQKILAKQLVTILNTHLRKVNAQMPYYKSSQEQIPFPLTAFEKQF
jgi:arylsulfatase A-like enzyme